MTHLAREGILQQCTRVAARYATDSEILAVHAEGHLALVRHVIEKVGGTDVEGAEEGAAQSLSPGGGDGRLKLRLANNHQSDADASAADGETEGDAEAAGGGRESSVGRHKRSRHEHGSYEGNASDESALVAGFASQEGGAVDDFDSASGRGAGGVGRLPRARPPSEAVAMRPPEAPPAKVSVCMFIVTFSCESCSQFGSLPLPYFPNVFCRASRNEARAHRRRGGCFKQRCWCGIFRRGGRRRRECYGRRGPGKAR